MAAVLSGCGEKPESEFQQIVRQSKCVTAKQVYSDYQINEVAAQQKYQGKVNRICGIVEEIELNLMDEPTISLRGSFLGSVGIGGVDTTSAARLSKGLVAVFECNEINEFLGTPVLTECRMVPTLNVPTEAVSDSGRAVPNETSATAVAADAQPPSDGQERWECDFGDPRGGFSVRLTATSYQFVPYNPDGGQLQGAVKVLGEWNRGLAVTDLEFVGSGAPDNRWKFVQDEFAGKRKALIYYFVESSGDGAECTPPGEQQQYMVQ